MLAACGSSDTGASGAGSGGASGSGGSSGESSGGGGSSEGGSSGEGAGNPAPLSDLELGLVGVWRGAGAGEDVNYFVLQEDRTGCTWRRDGEDYGVRYEELQFEGWTLESSTPDADDRWPIAFTTLAGSPQDIDRYDPELDVIFIAGEEAFPMSWQSVTIPCDGTGTNATATDVERRGTYPDADGGSPSP